MANVSDRYEEISMPTTITVHKMPILSTFDPPPGFEIDRVIGPCSGDYRSSPPQRGGHRLGQRVVRRSSAARLRC